MVPLPQHIHGHVQPPGLLVTFTLPGKHVNQPRNKLASGLQKADLPGCIWVSRSSRYSPGLIPGGPSKAPYPRPPGADRGQVMAGVHGEPWPSGRLQGTLPSQGCGAPVLSPLPVLHASHIQPCAPACSFLASPRNLTLQQPESLGWTVSPRSAGQVPATSLPL